ncbi:MAG TPA: hypothetical protein PK597_05855, partial [Oscillospiraceae bacterium]|nr:hypothetical protein [Oscillospiraceae bacterium]
LHFPSRFPQADTAPEGGGTSFPAPPEVFPSPESDAPDPDGSGSGAEPGSIPEVEDVPEEAQGIDAEAQPHARENLFRRIFRRADRYADTMFEDEELENDPDELPDEESAAEAPEEPYEKPRRRWRRAPEPVPEVLPAELAETTSASLPSLRARCLAALPVCLALTYLTLSDTLPLPLPAPLAEPRTAVLTGCALLFAVLLLSFSVVRDGFRRAFRLEGAWESLVTLSAFSSLALGVLVFLGILDDAHLPFPAAAALSLSFTLFGDYLKRRGTRSACRAAASAASPYQVTRDSGKWNARGTFTKHPGPITGFVRQITEPDGTQRIFDRLAPLLVLASLLFAILCSFAQGEPSLFLWSFSGILAAFASFSGALVFALPFSMLSRRLAQSGAALAGWEGTVAMSGQSGIVLTDGDLFPPGCISLNGIKIFGDFEVDKVISYTASVIRAAECGLEKTFHDLLRSQGTLFRRVDAFCCYEGGGYGATIRGEQVLVGSAAFMHLMGVRLTQGLNVKSAAFCAINGELAGIFAIHYAPSSGVRDALAALVHDRLTPVLASRDFNLTPAFLSQRFRLRLGKLEFPPVERRRELSDTLQSHDLPLCALLAREGLVPFADAVVGGRRLRRTVLTSGVIAAVGSILGGVLAFYLSYAGSSFALSPSHLLMFLLMWLVPTCLLSGYINHF